MKISSLLNETVIDFKPFEKKVEDKKGAISGIQINKYFFTDETSLDYIIVDMPNGEIAIRLIYKHKASGQLIEVPWHTLDSSEIAQERLYKRYTNKNENSIYRRMSLKHELPHDDKYHSYKYELVSEERDEQ